MGKDGEFWKTLISWDGAGTLEGPRWPSPGKSSIQDPGQGNEQAVLKLLGPASRSTEGEFPGMPEQALRPSASGQLKGVSDG